MKKGFLLLLFLSFCVSSSVFAQTLPDVSTIPDDIKISIKTATASQSQPGQNIQNSYDGDNSTMYHSPYGAGTHFPVTLTYNFSPTNLDYIIYSTRTDGQTNGNFKKFQVLVKKQGETTYTSKLNLDFKGKSGSNLIKFETTQENVISVKFVVKSGKGNWVSCAEMEFYKKSSQLDYSQIFTDATCSEIKAGVTQQQINNINIEYFKKLATDLFNKTYSKEFRVAEFKAWPHPDDFSRNNRVGTYSLCDNPTGIFARAGDEFILFVDDLKGENITLVLKNYKAEEGQDGYYNNVYFPLKSGVNKIKAENDGLFYVFYHTPDHLNAPKIKMHFAYARVNGYYDRQKYTDENANAEWKKLLNATKYEYYDVLGEYAHLSFPTSYFKRNARTNGDKLIEVYDELIFTERDFMGYYKYPNRNPYNRSHFVVNYKYFMYSDAYHTSYKYDTLDGLTKVNNLRKSPWGPAHEVGHSNQHTPLFRWVGMTEVSNNLQSLYVQTKWGNTSRLMAEDKYTAGFREIIVAEKAHCDVKAPGEEQLWWKLVPLWQLQLMFGNVLERDGFYAQVYEECRTRTMGSNHGQYQINFVKIVSDVAKYDLTEFFEAWGLLKPVNKLVDDYQSARLRITSGMSKNAKRYIKNKNYPKLPYKLQYITDANWEIYKNQSKIVVGTAVRIGSQITTENWKNVIVYEVWQGDKLVAIQHQSNEISIPGDIDEQTKVYAIQYDGTKIEVVPNQVIEAYAPKISKNGKEYWYYVKNMDNEAPRAYATLRISKVNEIASGVKYPLFKNQKFKLVEVGDKIGIVNENGLYLSPYLQGSNTPYGWTLEAVTQGGSFGYRFVIYQEGELITVAHLSTGLQLMNYTNEDAASLWQFIPTNLIEISTEQKEKYYKITSMKELNKGLDYSGDELSVSETTDKMWKLIDYNTSYNYCYIVNKEGKYLYLKGTTPKLSDKPTKVYLYLITSGGVVGCKISSIRSSSSSSLSLLENGNLGRSSHLSKNIMWYFDSNTSSDVYNVPNDMQYKVYVNNGKIVVENSTQPITIYNINGQQVRNNNLSKGIYLVRIKESVLKVLVH